MTLSEISPTVFLTTAVLFFQRDVDLLTELHPDVQGKTKQEGG